MYLEGSITRGLFLLGVILIVTQLKCTMNLYLHASVGKFL